MPFIEVLLSTPWLFDWQQRLCNDYSIMKEEFKDYLEVSGKAILDIGCSTGVCANTIVSMDRNRYVGIDIEPGYIHLANKRYPQGTFLVMDVRDLQFEDNSFDVVLFISTLHHMDDELAKGCIREVKRVVKDEGVVLVAEPVFTEGLVLSNLLLILDRGRYIRDSKGYKDLFDDFIIIRENYFTFPPHRFYSLVLKKGTAWNL